MHLGLVDEAFKHHKIQYSNEYCTPEKSFTWDRSCNQDIVVFTDRCILQSRRKEYKDKKRVAWLIEPFELQRQNYYDAIHMTKDGHFCDIFTHDIDCVNGCFCHTTPVILGGTWIYRKDWNCYYKPDLKKKISIIASDKKYLAGHKLRHDIIQKFGNVIDVFGRTYNPIDYKLHGLKDYTYQIVVENVRKNNWFTEKLIDCFLTGTIPIYWGAPNIEEYFDTRGMMTFDSLETLEYRLLETMKPDDIFKYREDNFHKAKYFASCENQIYDRVQKRNYYK